MDCLQYEFDEIIDVRSATEYDVDCIPGAINLPALSAAERAEVGILHKTSPFEARRHGAGLVAFNLSRYLQTHLSSRPPEWRPLVYCWRGGARSGAVVEVFRRIGWQAQQLPGGYKTYRCEVIDSIANFAPNIQWVVIGGRTGTGKTHVLSALRNEGHCVVDLESLGNHRGSAFGGNGQQPSQRKFETRLCEALSALSSSPNAKTKPVFVEAESRKIGALHVPQPLLAAMRRAPVFYLHSTVQQRARRIVADYTSMKELDSFAEAAECIGKYVSARQKEAWMQQHAAKKWEALAESLLYSFYDIGYKKSLAANYANIESTVCIAPECEYSIKKTAQIIAQKAQLLPSGDNIRL